MEKKSIFKRIDELYTKVTKTIIGDIPLDTDPQRSTHKSTTTVKKAETIKEKLASAKKKFLNLGKPNDEQRLLYKEVIKRESEEAKKALKIEQEAKKAVTTAKKEAKESAKKKTSRNKPSSKNTVTKTTPTTTTAKKPTVKKTTTKSTNSKTTTKPVTKKKSTTTANVEAATKKATVKKPTEKKVTTKKTISKSADSKITTNKKPAIEVTAKSENSKATTKPTKSTKKKSTISTSSVKTPTKKVTVKKPVEKKVTTNKTKSIPRGSKKAEKIALYIEDIKKHYGEVDEDFVAIVVKNLGPSIYKADAELVSCSDPKELDTVRKNFLMKKLGIDASQSVLDAAIQDVCVELKDVRRKYRATFYYALAKKFKKESVLS